MSRGPNSDFQVKRIGAIALVVALVAMGAALNLQKFPGFRGTGYEAEFSDASGLHKGNMVQIAGIRVGRVSSIDLAGDHVVVHFSLDNGQHVGKDSEASIEVLNLLGEKYLNLKPEGSGETRRVRRSRWTGPTRATTSSRCSPSCPTRPRTSTSRSPQTALTTVADTMNRSSGEAQATFDGLSRLSQSIASGTRDPVSARPGPRRLPAARGPQG